MNLSGDDGPQPSSTQNCNNHPKAQRYLINSVSLAVLEQEWGSMKLVPGLLSRFRALTEHLVA